MALTSLCAGDFGVRLEPREGLMGQVVERINALAALNERRTRELVRASRVIGREGRMTERLDEVAAEGDWSTGATAVNSLIDDLVRPTTEVARVLAAVAEGDLSQQMALEIAGQPVKGEFLRIGTTVNTMVDQLSSFADEVTRVAREVGTEGKLGGQAQVRGVSGVWRDLTESVNSMAGNLTSQVRNIAQVTTAVAQGDLSQKITVDAQGEILELKSTVNTMVDQLSSFADEVTRVAREVGTEGRLGGQAQVRGVSGTWRDLTDSVNSMASNLTGQVRNIAHVATAVAKGDLSKTITVGVKGEILQLKNTINTMVDQLNAFASEVTRVAREVGTEGKLGGQAQVQGVGGTWKDLTDNVNPMAANLTTQVRGSAKVVTHVANGDLKRKLVLDVKGEIAELADTINSMTDTLATFAEQVTTVAREVGVEGKLGGQAKVPGAAGTWKALTENVNGLAANLTTQVRAIAEVATAVTEGDLTRSIAVQAQGEVAVLKDTINEMIVNLKETTEKNTEQDWLKTNLAKFSRMLQGQRDLKTVGRLILSDLAPVVKAQHALFFVLDSRSEPNELALLASYAAEGLARHGKRLALGEGLIGQCALEKQKILLDHAPADYIRISSGLGNAAPRSLLVLPIVFEGQVKGVLELASFEGFSSTHQAFLEQLTESIGIVINTIESTTRTEDLLTQSQSLAHELQSRQDELQQTNQELQDKAGQLAHQNQEVERKNAEVEQARQALEEKARQLALTSKYKSEFLANMSHELRTPLNSLLILSDQLSGNTEGNLSSRQIEFSKTIHSSGNDLLMLINDILDLSKIESGTVVVDVGELPMDELYRYVDRTFRPVAESRKLEFLIRLAEGLPASMLTDAKRLQQIIKNLLSNAFKFTHRGQVTLAIEPAAAGWSADNEALNRAPQVLAFSVSDTGIGIPPEKQQIIFEAFQQADGSTSRKYGGTGLGLAISRELSRLLRGEIRLFSTPGRGSTFVLYVPQNHAPNRVLHGEEARGPALPAPAAPFAEARIGDVPALARPETQSPPEAPRNEADDDRERIGHGDPVLLIVENDIRFARVLLDAARANGFKGLVSPLGTAAIGMAREYRPAAITLDIHLPDIEGWRVLERLKHDLDTRHVPVCVISTEEARERAWRGGAWSFLAKPIRSAERLTELMAAAMALVKRGGAGVLLIAPKAFKLARTIREFEAGISVKHVASAAAAVAPLAKGGIDCIVASAASLVPAALPGPIADAIGEGRIPLIVYDEASRVHEDDAAWHRLLRHGRVRLVRSPERFADQLAFALHSEVATLPAAHRGELQDMYRSNKLLAGKRALIVDDDMRNIFALSSVLEEYDMDIRSTDNGRDAINMLQADPGVDIVLMDIMMPEMDGLDTMREIRRIDACRDLPIVAVTAKAMKGDRERCLEAGAWDYLSKPVDTEQLLGTLRAWLYR